MIVSVWSQHDLLYSATFFPPSSIEEISGLCAFLFPAHDEEPTSRKSKTLEITAARI